MSEISERIFSDSTRRSVVERTDAHPIGVLPNDERHVDLRTIQHDESAARFHSAISVHLSDRSGLFLSRSSKRRLVEKIVNLDLYWRSLIFMFNRCSEFEWLETRGMFDRRNTTTGQKKRPVHRRQNSRDRRRGNCSLRRIANLICRSNLKGTTINDCRSPGENAPLTNDVSTEFRCFAMLIKFITECLTNFDSSRREKLSSLRSGRSFARCLLFNVP